MRLWLALGIVILGTRAAIAVDPQECELQRAQYPKNWTDVSNEKPLFDCSSHYVGGVRVKIGTADGGGRTMMSLVPLKQGNTGVAEDTSKTIYRIWLDKEQLEHLKSGKYFATILRKEDACWIRGDLDQGDVFFMDNSDPPADGLRSGAGSFYNKAPRFSVFQDNAYDCKAAK